MLESFIMEIESKYKLNSDLNMHILRMHEENFVFCDICEVTVSSFNQLKRNKRIKAWWGEISLQNLQIVSNPKIWSECPF